MPSFRDIWNIIIDADSKGFKRGVDEAGNTVDTTFKGKIQGALSKFGVSSQGAGDLLGGAVAGGALAAGAAIEQFVEKSIGEFQRQSQEVLHFRDVSGLAADEASRFVAVADDFGVSGEGLSKAIGKMDTAAGATDKLKALGIEIGHTKDGAYDAEQTFLNVVDEFNNTDDASRKAAIGAGVFGKGWQDMSLLLEQGSGKLKKSFADVKDYQIFSDADLQKSEDYRHAMDDLDDSVKGFQREVGEAAIPIVVEFTQELIDMGESADAALKPFGGLSVLMRALATAVFPGYESTGGNVADISQSMADKTQAAMNAVLGLADGTLPAIQSLKDLATKIDFTAGASSDYVRGNAAYRQALDDQRLALEKVTIATDNFRAAQRKLRDDQLGLQGSIYSSLDAIDAYRVKSEDATATAREQEQANIHVQQSFDDVAQKAIDTAAQQAVLHGSVLTANGAIDAQRAALREVAKELGPEDGKVRAELDRYLLALSNIPGQIVTNVDLTGNGLDILGRSVIGTRREGTGAGGYSTPAEVVGAVKSYEASNGTGWRTGASGSQ